MPVVLGTLLAREAHEENHEDVASTLLRTRRKAWIIQGRRTVKKALSIEDAAAKNGTADSPHRNGAAEAAVKLLKRALMSLGGATESLT
ncbi:hypothetical protein DPEC_G00248420 [Dallia pectoralis]|uniref:Uncharacterized protein n=1 Tax=Dallia pectoralis TaxID=75939 RepID=A0ACC2FWZ9_DALPE|nr:hypothetical protein DPEC_G00248420 [Dallia pectoralis]